MEGGYTLAQLKAFNQESADELGWDPTWLGLPPDEWGQDLVDAIASFQHSFFGDADGPGVVDGWCGWSTFLRLWNLRQSTHPEPEFDAPITATETDSFLYDGKLYRVPCAVVTPGEEGALPIIKHYWRCPRKKDDGSRCNGRRYSKPGKCKRCGTRRKRGRRFKERRSDKYYPGKPHSVIQHWPVGESARGTHAGLSRKGISSHGSDAWNGVFYQYVDFAETCFHATSRQANETSIGLDITLNPVRKNREEAQQELEAKGRPRRPEIEGVKVGSWPPGTFLYYYDAQLITLAALRAGFFVHLGIPMESPYDKGPKRFMKAHPKGDARTVQGWKNHSDVQGGKWDGCISDDTPIPSIGKTVIELAREYVEQGW
jgi:hypothetical protein